MNTLAGTRPRAPTQLHGAQRRAENTAALSSDCRVADPTEWALIQDGLRYATKLVAALTQLRDMDLVENPRHQTIHGLTRSIAGELEQFNCCQKCGPDGGAA